jgi:hypothetical protein
MTCTSAHAVSSISKTNETQITNKKKIQKENINKNRLAIGQSKRNLRNEQSISISEEYL